MTWKGPWTAITDPEAMAEHVCSANVVNTTKQLTHHLQLSI
jgi:hypothetical protein